MMNQTALGELVLKKRREKALTQEELAALCKLDTRTIQRIEKGEVKPYFSTLKILSRELDYDFISAMNKKPWQFSEGETGLYREKFKKRKFIRIAIFIGGMSLMLAVLTSFPNFRLLGMAKSTWAPFFYVIMFALIIGIGIIWRCPACNALLGDPFKIKFCSKCGFKFSE
ncbi:MAG: helix-turn-helix domain-containing protein [Candidatus Aminicenantes bacterium]|nr:helix-turn-helix domain-containing protein [Candidatus Aminicenantes bacterium]